MIGTMSAPGVAYGTGWSFQRGRWGQSWAIVPAPFRPAARLPRADPPGLTPPPALEGPPRAIRNPRRRHRADHRCRADADLLPGARRALPGAVAPRNASPHRHAGPALPGAGRAQAGRGARCPPPDAPPDRPVGAAARRRDREAAGPAGRITGGPAHLGAGRPPLRVLP